MEESSKNVSSVDISASDVERKLEAASFCNDTNITTTNMLKSEPGMTFSQCPKNPVPGQFPSSDYHYLADLYWKYPTVHQTYVVSPGLHTNQALLAKARRKSEKLRKELEKEPERHRVSQDAFSHTQTRQGSRKTADFSKTNSRKSKVVIAAAAPVQQRRRTVNMSVVGQTNKNVNVNRRLTLQPVPVNRSRKVSKGPKTSDPGAALAEFRTAKGLSKTNTTSDKTPVYSETPVVLDALREQREDLEKREEEIHQSSFIHQVNRKVCGCGVFRKCIGSYRVTYVAFFVLVLIIIILCISAIVYPIARAVMLKNEGSKPKK